MKTLRNTLPPGHSDRRLPARDPSRGFAGESARRDLPDAPRRVIKLGPARLPHRGSGPTLGAPR